MRLSSAAADKVGWLNLGWVGNHKIDFEIIDGQRDGIKTADSLRVYCHHIIVHLYSCLQVIP